MKTKDFHGYPVPIRHWSKIVFYCSPPLLEPADRQACAFLSSNGPSIEGRPEMSKIIAVWGMFERSEFAPLNRKMILPLNRPGVAGHGFAYFRQDESRAGSNASLRLVPADCKSAKILVNLSST